MSISWENERQFLDNEQRQDRKAKVVQKQESTDTDLFQRSTKRPIPKSETAKKIQQPRQFVNDKRIMLDSREGRIIHFPVYDEIDLNFKNLAMHKLRHNKHKDEDIDSDDDVIFNGWKYMATNLCLATNIELLTKRFDPKIVYPYF